MKILKRHWLIVILVTLAVAVIAAFQLKGNDNPQYFTAKVDRGDISQVVEATGTINAVTTVQVGSQVSGTVSRLYVDFNSRVKRGQVIAQIDPALFEGSLLQAKADLANARASVATAKANLQKALALQIQTSADYERAKALTAQRVSCRSHGNRDVGVLRVPNSALRYKPDMNAEEIRAIYQKFGLDNPGPPSVGNHAAANNGPEYVGEAVKKVNRRTSAGQNEAIGLTTTAPHSPDGVVLWKVRPDRTLEPVRIRSGITDHTVTEVAEVFNGSLNSDEDLVTGAVITGPKMGPGTKTQIGTKANVE